MSVSECDHPKARLIVTQVRVIDQVEHDDGVWVLFGQDFDDPDTVQVEFFCPTCGRQNLLRDDEWEVA